MVILVPSFMSLKASYKRLIYEGNTLYIEEASKTTINVESLFYWTLYTVKSGKRNASGAALKKREEIFECCHVEK